MCVTPSSALSTPQPTACPYPAAEFSQQVSQITDDQREIYATAVQVFRTNTTTDMSLSQVVGSTIIGEDGLVVMAGAKSITSIYNQMYL